VEQLVEISQNKSNGNSVIPFSLILYGIFICILAVQQKMEYGADYKSVTMINHGAVIGLVYPFVLFLRGKEKYLLALLFILAAIFIKDLLVISCILLASYLFLWSRFRKFAILLIPLIVFFTPYIYRELNIDRHVQQRMVDWKTAKRNWDNMLFGEGLGAFSKLPENQPIAKNIDPTNGEVFVYSKKWHKTAHSDLLQGFMEFGTVGMSLILLIFSMPLVNFRLNNFGVAYIILAIQAIIDFPFHREYTFMVAILIMFGMWKR